MLPEPPLLNTLEVLFVWASHFRHSIGYRPYRWWVGNRELRTSTQSVPAHSRDGRASLFGEETPCASSCPATAWSPPQAPSRRIPVGWPPRSTSSRWSPAPDGATDRCHHIDLWQDHPDERRREVCGRPGMTDEVLYARDGRLGQILLNRPKVINALTGPMVTSVLAQLQDWAQDDAVLAVSIQGAGERGLCAGNDVRALREGLMQGHGSAGAVQFWAHESHLNAAIAGFPKPFVAFMDGIVMGGGVGISAHGSLRLVTERSRVAMPETAIGFFPDVGSLFLLSRAPGEIGTHLAMTGLSVGGADAVTCGLADALFDSQDIPGLIARLAAGEALDADVGSTSAV